MSDRELLELAAKAAGIRINYWVYDNDDDSPSVLESGGIWNPLTNDGDALRLAVKLRIDLIFMLSDENEGEAIVYVGEDIKNESIRASLKDDPDAATRRAIVRAAVEIGRNMT